MPTFEGNTLGQKLVNSTTTPYYLKNSQLPSLLCLSIDDRVKNSPEIDLSILALSQHHLILHQEKETEEEEEDSLTASSILLPYKA